MENKKIEALISADEYLYNLKEAIEKISTLIDEGKEGEGIKLIPSVADGIDWVVQVINLTKEIQKEAIEIDTINEYLEELVEALENEDYILVGDLFNYEILPILKGAHEKIKLSIAI